MFISEEQFQDKLNNSYIPTVSEDGIIAKKEVFGKPRIDRIIVPYGVIRIEDWAFAHCTDLKEVWLPDTLTGLGRDVFLGDDRLAKLVIYGLAKKDGSNLKEAGYYIHDEISALPVIAVNCFKSSALHDFSFTPIEAWLDWFDRNLCDYISAPDDEGFDPFLAGGEEDYEDPENDIEYYRAKIRERKCGYIFERIKVSGESGELDKTSVYDGNIDRDGHSDRDNSNSMNNSMNIYTEYLTANKNSALDFVLSKRHDSYEYFKLYADLNMIAESDVPGLLDRFSDEDYLECKAYLIKYQDTHFKKQDVWDMFKL